MATTRMSIEILVAFAGYYFARKPSLQSAIGEIRSGWNGVESYVPSFTIENDHYEVYLATFGRIILRIRKHEEDGTEELISLTVVPKDPPPFEVTLRSLSNDIVKRKMSISLKNTPPADKEKGYIVKFNYQGRSLEVVTCHGSVQMLTIWELPDQE